MDQQRPAPIEMLNCKKLRSRGGATSLSDGLGRCATRKASDRSEGRLTSATLCFAPGVWMGTVSALGLATLVALAFDAVGFTEANLVMIYLLAVVVVATRHGSLPSVATSALAVLLFDVLFTTPYYRITVHDTQYLVTFTVMLAVGLLASTLTARVRYQADEARRNERRTEALYRLSRRLTAIPHTRELVDEAQQIVSDVFAAHAVIFLPDEKRRIRPLVSRLATFAASASEIGAAQWVFDHSKVAGADHNAAPSGQAVYVPMTTPNDVVGVLAVQPEDLKTLPPDARRLLDAYATQIALAIERDRLAGQSKAAEVQIETEKMRSSLLSAVSHDLRTPLAAIAGAASSIAEGTDFLDPATKTELLETICEESERLSRLVENLLHMTRLSNGTINVDRQWHPIDEVIGSALNRLARELAQRHVYVNTPDDLTLGHFDDVLVEQLIVNLLDNAAKYSASGSPICIRAERLGAAISVEVSDRGRGLADGDQERVFEMFYRGMDPSPGRRGSGLGLAICKAVVSAHGGSIQAANRPGGGTSVRFLLPYHGAPPTIDLITAGQNQP